MSQLFCTWYSTKGCNISLLERCTNNSSTNIFFLVESFVTLHKTYSGISLVTLFSLLLYLVIIAFLFILVIAFLFSWTRSSEWDWESPLPVNCELTFGLLIINLLIQQSTVSVVTKWKFCHCSSWTCSNIRGNRSSMPIWDLHSPTIIIIIFNNYILIKFPSQFWKRWSRIFQSVDSDAQSSRCTSKWFPL